MGRTLKLVTISTWKEYLSEFLTTKKIQGCRERTIQDYQYHIHHFFKTSPDCLEEYHLISQAVSEYFAVSDIAPATFNIRRVYLKSFFSYLVEEGVIPKNPIAFPKRKDECKARNVSHEILTELLKQPDKKTFSGLRDYCLILFTLDTGIRPGEALLLLPGDINLPGMEITIRSDVAKTKVTRTVPISSLTVTHIQKLLRARLTTWNDTIPVFCSYEGHPMLETSWAHRLKGYSNRLGHSVTPYSLRHSFALLYLAQLPHGSLENPTIEGFFFKTRHYGISVLEKKTFRGFMGSSGIWSFW